jgi:hypothetical protein
VIELLRHGNATSLRAVNSGFFMNEWENAPSGSKQGAVQEHTELVARSAVRSVPATAVLTSDHSGLNLNWIQQGL